MKSNVTKILARETGQGGVELAYKLIHGTNKHIVSVLFSFLRSLTKPIIDVILHSNLQYSVLNTISYTSLAAQTITNEKRYNPSERTGSF